MTLKMMEEGIVKEMMTTKMRMTFLMMTEENCMMKSMSPLMVWKLNQKHLTVLLILHQLSSPSRPLRICNEAMHKHSSDVQTIGAEINIGPG